METKIEAAVIAKLTAYKNKRRLGVFADRAGIKITRLSEIIHGSRKITDHYLEKLISGGIME